MKFLNILLSSVLVVSLIAPAMAEDLKMGFVDLSRLFDEYHKTKEYDTYLESIHTDFEDTRNEKISEIRESQARLGLLTEDKKSELESDIEKKKADLLEFDRQKKTDLTKKRNEKIQEILLEIEQVVSDYAEKEKYSVILNDRVLIYGSPVLDITEQVLTILNEK